MKKINEAFVCVHCGKAISQATKTCRNHCPYCFVSLHVDGNIPGDRSSFCPGLMYPTTYEIKNGQYKICFVCAVCGKIHRNKRADDDQITMLPTLIQHYKERLY